MLKMASTRNAHARRSGGALLATSRCAFRCCVTYWLTLCTCTRVYCYLLSGDDASAAAVPSLVKLCLQTIGKRLKHFFKCVTCREARQTEGLVYSSIAARVLYSATQHAALVARLSEQEKQLLLALDLSRLELFEHQKFRQWIAAWRLRVEKKRRDMCVWLCRSVGMVRAANRWAPYTASRRT